MLIFADWDIEAQKDGISHNHKLNHWQCMGQSPELLTLCEPLEYSGSERVRNTEYLSAWFKEPPSISEYSFVKYNSAKGTQQGFKCSSCNSNFFHSSYFPGFGFSNRLWD